MSSAHKNLEGLTNCTNCHELGKKVSSAKCLDCHTEIKKLAGNSKGYHGFKAVKEKQCFDCHSEHHGRSFALIKFDRNNFDHGKTGFVLTGRHQTTNCEKCHNDKNFERADVKRRNTFLYLSSTCAKCHQDPHLKQLGDKCESCHNTERFKPSLYNHDKSAFKLTGSHQKVLCGKCHISEKRNNFDVVKYKGLSFANCSSCHKDPHAGRLGDDCKKCHNTSGFNKVNKAGFDHSLTNFHLIGKHKIVKCETCHGKDLSAKPRHEQCSDCHKDYHKGQLRIADKSRECNDCHTEEGFDRSLFTESEHNTNPFPLLGAHLAVPCNACHLKNNEWTFSKIGAACVNCHKNPHGNEITETFLGKDKCDNCHNVTAWKLVTFDHSRTKFALSGKHASADCGKCHKRMNAAGTIYEFASLGTACQKCHNDVHGGQFSGSGGVLCDNCHTPENWNPVKFNHENTTFSLTGAHGRLNCKSCHKPANINGATIVQYKLGGVRCSSCHL